MTLSQVAAALGCDMKESGHEILITGVTTDSRKVQQGNLYVPIVGENFDGHDFIGSALENGAVAALTSKPSLMSDAVLQVADTRLALGRLAAWHRRRFKIPVIGITGSVGKTSTKEMMAAILGQKFKVHKTSGNYNNDIGLPLTLLELEEDHEAAVVELGMNHFGEIDYLASILAPTHGMITNIGVSHIEYLGSREGILKAKAEMLPYIDKGGIIVLNGDDDLLVKVEAPGGIRTVYYGASETCNMVMKEWSLTEGGGQYMYCSSDDNTYEVTVDYPGEHILHNALGCILMAEALGMEKEAVEEGIKSYAPAGMRLNRYSLGHGSTILDDAYNASVDSMESALKTMASMATDYNKTIAVLGSMFEMGDYSEEGHRVVGGYVCQYEPDLLLTVGRDASWIKDSALEKGYPEGQAIHFETQEELMAAVGKLIDDKTLILIKGSRGMFLEKTRDLLLESFED